MSSSYSNNLFNIILLFVFNPRCHEIHPQLIKFSIFISVQTEENATRLWGIATWLVIARADGAWFISKLVFQLLKCYIWFFWCSLTKFSKLFAHLEHYCMFCILRFMKRPHGCLLFSFSLIPYIRLFYYLKTGFNTNSTYTLTLVFILWDLVV